MSKTPFKKEVEPIPSSIDKRRKEVPEMRASIFTQLKGYGDLNPLYKNVQSVLDTDGELPAAEYSDLYGYLVSKRGEYLNGSNDQQALIKRELNMMKTDVVAYKNFRQDLAAAINTKSTMNGWVDSAQGQAVTALLEDNSRLVQKDCGDDPNCPDKGKLGVVLPALPAAKEAERNLDELYAKYDDMTYSASPGFDNNGMRNAEDNWMDVLNNQPNWTEEDKNLERNLKRIIRSNGERWVSVSNLKSQVRLQDSSTREVLNTMGNNYLNQSTRVNWADGVEFNREAAARQVEANVIGKSNNYESLIYDEMISGRTFYDDILERIKNQTYGSLGFTNIQPNQDMLDVDESKMDMETAIQSLYYMPGVNPDDGIDDEEAQIITDELINNPIYKDILDKEMVNYFVNYLRNQWVMGEKNRPAPVETKKEEDNINRDYL